MTHHQVNIIGAPPARQGTPSLSLTESNRSALWRKRCTGVLINNVGMYANGGSSP